MATEINNLEVRFNSKHTLTDNFDPNTNRVYNAYVRNSRSQTVDNFSVTKRSRFGFDGQKAANGRLVNANGVTAFGKRFGLRSAVDNTDARFKGVPRGGIYYNTTVNALVTLAN